MQFYFKNTEKTWPTRQPSQPQLGVYQACFGDSNLIHLQDKYVMNNKMLVWLTTFYYHDNG